MGLSKSKVGKYIPAVFLMFLGTIGSGIFVLPYLFLHSNLVFAVFFFAILTLISLFLNYFYADIVTSTPGDHQLAGYAQIYLGSRFGHLARFNLLLLAFGAIAAYQKLFQSFFLVLFPHLPLSIITLLYFVFSIVYYFSYFHRRQNQTDTLVGIIIFLIPLIIFFFSLVFHTPSTALIVRPNLFFFGATIYALSGFTIIPEVQQLILESRQKVSLRLVLSLASVLVFLAYLLFALGVIRLSGVHTTPDSVSGIASNFPWLALLLSVFGSITVIRASYGFLLILHELFYRDMHLSSTTSRFLPFVFPILSLFLAHVSLVSVISLTGHFTVFVSALLICLIRLKLKFDFSTQFWSILIILSLSLGLVVNLF